jgi:photoactive yellow protein
MKEILPDFLTGLPRMNPTSRDALAFGCVQVDDTGKVLSYNRYESELSGVAPKEAIGRNFFRELAPCTNNRLVFGQFKAGVAAGKLDTTVAYAFTYKMRPTLVQIRLYRDAATSTNWVLVKRMGGRK